MNSLKSVLLFILFFSFSQIFAQRPNSHDPIKIFVPTLHDTKLAKVYKQGKSFYQQKDKWQEIIDSTWGSGDPLQEKLDIFNTYVKAIDEEYPCFPNLSFNWDSLKTYYRNKIDSTTSRGRFAAIMSHLAYNLREFHTSARDSLVLYSPLNPSTPILILGSFNDIKHFGAALTILEDSSIAVLKVVNNHPLNLEPGDIILGYEGVPWKDLIEELLKAELPIVGYWGGCPSAYFDAKMICAGMNWHLFETIDIKKYSTGEIQSLPTSLMLSLVVFNDWLYNNEQLKISNIPFPDYDWDHGQNVTYGILKNTNIGFIYLIAENYEDNRADNEFFEAVSSLKETDGLIIDMRYNIGGWAFFPAAFNILFNYQKLYTIEDAYRCSPSNWNMCVGGEYTEDYAIDSDPNTFYEKPIAVLIGPSCVSMGDLTTYRLKYHPNVRLFGKSSNASLSENTKINKYNNWLLNYAKGDMVRLEDPTNFLNQKEVPVDYPIWFDLDDIANNHDTVLEEAKKYVTNLAQTCNEKIDKPYSNNQVSLIADVLNPNEHELSVIAQIENDSEILDSINCQITNNTIQESVDISNYPEDFYSVSIITEDKDENTKHFLPNIVKFTNVGPLVVDTFTVTPANDTAIGISEIQLTNLSTNITIEDIGLVLSYSDTCITKNWNIRANYGDLLPGDSKISYQSLGFNVKENSVNNYQVNFEISSKNVVYWNEKKDIDLNPVGIEVIKNLPTKFDLSQNYPNPFNPSTTIKYNIPTDLRYETLPTGRQVQDVRLIVYDILGRKVKTLVNQKQKPGNYEVQWNASEYPSGIYFYKLTAGDYTATKKMILIK